MIDWPNGPKKIQYLGGTKSVARATRDEARRIAGECGEAAVFASEMTGPKPKAN